ncbi:oleoyl-ACP hydrolase [Longispora fulva]|uniref:Surfactin synthase thioesterase subunit n=1 Tax=Longispora fulva TaxID=619741 RepID=A0A8J7KU78_9ACTN|nr:alpha/beta fold hydrolase [Longispora fulva]MBG6141552.1 surfactin synthase thioesterase subunit [Longispora fulva]GIG59295.1 oleoyl-ACP hydrolase [Longispora fulva]
MTTSESPARSTTWLRRFRPAADAAVSLVCLPHAGGSASFFFPVSRALAPAIDVLAVQYPGRQDRRHEPNIDNLPELADRIVDALTHMVDRPFALFGHSMGAMLAYEIALRLAAAGLPAPTRVFLSGRRAPSRHRDDRVHLMSDGEILAQIRRLNGTDLMALDDPDIRDMILPVVRNDYRAVETYRHDPSRVLDCPVTVLTGDRDPLVTVDEARAWEEHTTGPTDLLVLPGGHFYLVEQSERVLDVIRRRLSASGGSAASPSSATGGRL